MKNKLIRRLRARYPEFGEVFEFTRRHELPVFGCSIRAWPWDNDTSIPWGYSNRLENVAMAICQARIAASNTGRDLGEVKEQSVRRTGTTVIVSAPDGKLASFTRMTPATTKQVQATEELRAKFRYFDHAMEFAKRHRLPTGKCAVHGNPWEYGGLRPWGYTASAEQVAAAISSVWAEFEAEMMEPCEVDCLPEDLYVVRKGHTVFIKWEEWELMRFTRLTPQRTVKVREKWFKEICELESKKRSKNSSPQRIRARPSRCDPFKTGDALFSYMPGGKLDSTGSGCHYK